MNEQLSRKQLLSQRHELLSIAASAYINGTHTSKVWIIENSTDEARKRITTKFVQFCRNGLDRMVVDEKLEISYQQLKIELANTPFYKKEIRSKLLKQEYEIRLALSLPILGYNSAKYDIPILSKFLFEAIDKCGICQIGKIRTLKRGKKYVSIDCGRLTFRDLILFTCPMSLDRYLKCWGAEVGKLVFPYSLFPTVEEIRCWGAEVGKLVFPYSLFPTVEEIRECIVFPSIDEFKVDKDVDVDVYNMCKSLFEERMSLPGGHVDRWYNFADYLEHYNLSDVLPTSLAMIKQFEIFETAFGLSPYQSMGLPQYAKKAMYKMYNNNSPAIFSFNEGSSATSIFRQNILGGLVNVYKRHVTLDPTEDVPRAAKFNKWGKPWKKIYFFDINAMYPATFREDMPCGRGFEWILHGRVFQKKLMTDKKISLPSVQWIAFMENDNRFVDKSGQRCKIVSGWNSEEVKFGKYDVDGYCKVDDIEYALEFDGCYFHGCQKCKEPGIQDPEEGKRRHQYLKRQNLTIIRMQGCVWTKKLRQLNTPPTLKSPISSLLYRTNATEAVI